MEAFQIAIDLKNSSTNFVDLPPQLVETLQRLDVKIQDVIVKITWKAKRAEVPNTFYAGWSGNHSDDGSLGISVLFANSIGISESSKVDLAVLLDAPTATTISVDPVSESDWEVIELHAGVLESLILQQSRVVKLNQQLTLYVSNTTHARVTVVGFEPSSPKIDFAKIDLNNCEVIVTPRERRKKKTQSVRSASSSRHIEHISPHVLLRGIALPHPMFKVENTSAFEVYVNFEEAIHTLHSSQYVSVSLVPGPNTKQANIAHDEKPHKTGEARHSKKSSVVAKLVHYSEAQGVVGLSESLSISLGCHGSVGETVVLEETSKPSMEKNPRLVIRPLITQTAKSEQVVPKNLEKDRQKTLLKQKEIESSFHRLGFNNSVLTQGMVLPAFAGSEKGSILEFKNIKSHSILISSNATITIGNEILWPESQIPYNIDSIAPKVSEVQHNPVGIDTILKKIERSIRRDNVGALLYGPTGTGKTLVITEISKRLQDKGFYKIAVDGSDISKEGNLAIKEKIDNWIVQCSWYSPSVLVLEGIDSIFPAEAEHTDSSQTKQLAEFFINAVNKIRSPRNLIILATAKSKESLNKLLITSHCLEESFNLPPPDKETRRLILEQFLKESNITPNDSFDISEITLETEGYLPNDLKVLVDRIQHEAAYRSIEQANEKLRGILTSDILKTAISGYTPSNLRGVKLQSSTTSWADIGGLTEAKSILLETLEWPTKYAPIFRAATLRLRSGILLYGYPGCGKTLLASAVAGQCGLNFISVKGPEILNKYIGASEQSVRELFERAQAAKPCILFFDEFDSIAPKRGHDSTGVTDRVVNQMLTQMDGAEGLDGVYVLAATSRPDLIDSALLRPGRLDKCVICDMPDFADRLSILESITRNMDLGNDVDLKTVADNTEGFSGADLQALGYNAYLQSVHEKLEKDEMESNGKLKREDTKIHEFFQVSLNKMKTNEDLKPHERSEVLRQLEPLFENLMKDRHEKEPESKINRSEKDNGVRIFQKDLLDALKDTKPSISVSEKLKLGGIYSKFISSRDGNMPDGSTSNEIGGRSTLM